MSEQTLPPPILQAQKLLATCIRSRQEAAFIRRIIAVHLDSHVEDTEGGHDASGLFSLPTDTVEVRSSDSSIRGLRREYLKSLRANVRARHEYQRLCQEQELASDEPTTKPEPSLDTYLALIKQRQTLQRLYVLQDHIQRVSQKPAAAPKFLDVQDVVSQLDPLPHVPVEVMSDPQQVLETQVTVEELLSKLERSVLRAQASLKSEKRRLADVKAAPKAAREQPRVEALGRTRNELISWIEEELGKAGEDTAPGEDPNTLTESIDQRSTAIREQYRTYLAARQDLIESVTAKDLPLSFPGETKAKPAPSPELRTDTANVSNVAEYLPSLLDIASEQKGLIQQKAHFTGSLSKEHSETLSLLNRLAEESHLLPAYGPRSNAAPTVSRSFGEALNTPKTAERAKEWAFAADSANIATKEAILESVELGKLALEDARVILVEEQELFGSREQEEPVTTPRSPRKRRGTGDEESEASRWDPWSILDGELGMIRADDA